MAPGLSALRPPIGAVADWRAGSCPLALAQTAWGIVLDPKNAASGLLNFYSPPKNPPEAADWGAPCSSQVWSASLPAYTKAAQGTTPRPGSSP